MNEEPTILKFTILFKYKLTSYSIEISTKI